MSGLHLKVLPERLAICRVTENADISDLQPRGRFWSLTRSPGEITLVCESADVPKDVVAESGWRCLQVSGPLDFNQIGVLSSLAAPLATAGISIYVISTYDTDCLLVRSTNLNQACDTLRRHGHDLSEE